jgi:seryl-tRNA(Sec) selenium transferase
MDIQFEKSKLMKKLEETNDLSIIEAIKKIFKSEKKDFWDELTQEQKFEIEEGDRQIGSGEFVDFEEFIQKYIE